MKTKRAREPQTVWGKRVKPESAIVATLPASGASYTAIVRGFNDTTGVALVEVYALD